MDIKIIAKSDEVLAALRANRAEHQQIVREAREGYVKKAKELLMAKLDDLVSGKIVSLQFDLHPPQDQTREYDAAIKMLELHQSGTIELEHYMIRCLVLNEWGWMDKFLTSNSAYSATAASKL